MVITALALDGLPYIKGPSGYFASTHFPTSTAQPTTARQHYSHSSHSSYYRRMKIKLSTRCIAFGVLIIVSTSSGMAVPITTDPLAQEMNADLMPCPKNWNPKAGRGPACRPNVKPENIEVGGINKAAEDNKDLMPCPKKWDPRFGKGPACRPLDGSP